MSDLDSAGQAAASPEKGHGAEDHQKGQDDEGKVQGAVWGGSGRKGWAW